jgi:hypothetical protein
MQNAFEREVCKMLPCVVFLPINDGKVRLKLSLYLEMPMPTRRRISEQAKIVHELLPNSLRNYSSDYENATKRLGTRVLLGTLGEIC